MKILLLGPVHREDEFLKQKDNRPFLEGQGQQSWVEALKRLGHQVFVIRYTDSLLFPLFLRVSARKFFILVVAWFSPAWLKRLDMFGKIRRFQAKYYFFSIDNFFKNRKILFLAKKTRPDLVLLSGGFSGIYPTTIKAVKKKYNSKIIFFEGVNPQAGATPVEKKMIRDKIVDVVVENDRGYGFLWEKLGAKKVIILPISSVDWQLHKKMKLSRKEFSKYLSDVCFVGTLSLSRQKKLACLGEFNLKIWGDIPLHHKLYDSLKPFYQGCAFGLEMVKIFNSAKIVLNFQPDDMKFGGNMRSFEIPGCGAFQLVDRIDSDWFEKGVEIETFKNLFDLKKKIKFYLLNEKNRVKMAAAGFARAHKDHTYERHFEKLFKEI